MTVSPRMWQESLRNTQDWGEWGQPSKQPAGANTSTGQGQAWSVPLAKSLYLPAQTQGQGTALVQKMNVLSAWKQMGHLIFLSWPLVQKPTGFNYVKEKSLGVDKKKADFLWCGLGVSSILTGKLKASHHLKPLLWGRWNIFWNSVRIEKWPRKSTIGPQKFSEITRWSWVSSNCSRDCVAYRKNLIK